MKTIVAILVIGVVLLFAGMAQDKPAAGAKGDPMPTLVKRADPAYPKSALEAGIEGTVYVKALVDTDGKVAKVEIIKSDAKELDKAALDAAKKFTFEAAVSGGKPVEVWVTIPFKFKLADGKDAKKK